MRLQSVRFSQAVDDEGYVGRFVTMAAMRRRGQIGRIGFEYDSVWRDGLAEHVGQV